MAEIDGIALAARLRASQPDLPIVFVTGFATLDERLAGERVLRKPFTMSELGRATWEAIRSRRNNRASA